MENHIYLIALRRLHYLVSGQLSEKLKEDTKLDIHTSQQGLCSFILPELIIKERFNVEAGPIMRQLD